MRPAAQEQPSTRPLVVKQDWQQMSWACITSHPIAFRNSGRADGCGVCLEIPRLGSRSWSEGKKDSLRRLRSRAHDILRLAENHPASDGLGLLFGVAGGL